MMCHGCGGSAPGGIVVVDKVGKQKEGVGYPLCRECLRKVMDFVNHLNLESTQIASDPNEIKVNWIK